MKILCVIDSLGSGGSQRQMVNLACALKRKGHVVEFFTYHPEHSFFRRVLIDAAIPIHEVYGISGFSFKVIYTLSRLLRNTCYDCVISFLPAPNIYSVLAALYSYSGVKLILSERASQAADGPRYKRFLISLIYLKASYLVANSFTYARSIERYPWLRSKTHVIYNGYTLDHDFSKEKPVPPKFDLSFLVIGRVSLEKNGVRLVQALLLFHQRNGFLPRISWAGRQESDDLSISMRIKMDKLISSNSLLKSCWHWLGERQDIPQLLHNCDALIHVSLHEGLPNVVCEAFIASKPVIISAVCDHALLVEEGVRGHLCDPLSPESICEAIERFCSLSFQDQKTMGLNSRQYAEQHLTLNRMVGEYEALLELSVS